MAPEVVESPVTPETSGGSVEEEAAATAGGGASTKTDDGKEPSARQEDGDDEAQGTNDENDEQLEEEKKDDAAAPPPAKKTDYSNYPLKDIREPHPHDVMFGRGGGTNHHPGNKRYRKMVEDRKVDYINSKRLDKPLVALEIIKIWRSQDPPGRFLKIDDKTGLWFDVGDKKAREKTSQALREKAPIIRKQQEDEEKARIRKEQGLPPEDEHESGEDNAAPQRPKPVMARDTTFGVEYIESGQSVTLEGFSWHEGIGDSSQRSTSAGAPPPPPPHYPPGSREGSYASGVPPQQQQQPIYRFDSHGSASMPPPSSFAGSTPTVSSTMAMERQFSSFSMQGRFESWSSIPPPGTTGYGPPPTPQGGWSDQQREHSLGQFALPHASIGHPASYATFDRRGPPPYPPGAYPPTYTYSGGPPPPPPPPPAGAYQGGPSYSGGTIVSPGSPSRPPYSVDPSVASTWSGKPEGEILQTLSGDEGSPPPPPTTTTTTMGMDASPAAFHKPLMGVKPDIVKRATSNQNETLETKPDLMIGGTAVKRAALNRDSSNAANRLKELCFPGQFKNGAFDVQKEVNELSAGMGRSTLQGGGSTAIPAPEYPERMSTLDMLPPIETTTIDEDSPGMAEPPATLVKPSILDTRSTTIEAIAASLASDEEDDVVASLGRVESVGTTTDLPKPNTWGYNDRLSTTELIQMVNEPVAEDDPELVSGQRQMLE